MIPENKRNAVYEAMQSTFDTSKFEAIRELTAGLSSALIFRIVVKNKPYLLRIITRIDAISDPSKWYVNMEAAAKVGVAPQVWYMGTGDRISITDFIEAEPFPVYKARVKLAALLRRLHALPPFPFRINYLDSIAGFIEKFQAEKIMPRDEVNEIFKVFSHIKSIYPITDADLVSCHNDLKPENMLFDGERAWLVDWEAAFLNDRYVDLAIVANFVLRNDDDEREFLETYFGHPPTAYQQAKFFLMRQLLHVSYFVAFMLFGGAATRLYRLSEPMPDFDSYHDGIWSGLITLEGNEARQRYAKVHLERFKNNILLNRFRDSMAIISNRAAMIDS